MSQFALRELKYSACPYLRREVSQRCEAMRPFASREQVGVLLQVGLFALGALRRPRPLDRVLGNARSARDRVARASSSLSYLRTLTPKFGCGAQRAGWCGSEAGLREALPTGPEAFRADQWGLWEQLWATVAFLQA